MDFSDSTQHLPSITLNFCHHVRSAWFLVVICLVVVSLPGAVTFDPLDPEGQIMIRWDIMGWTGDGYTATVNIINTQQYRGITSYRLGWKWAKKELIWTTQGAQVAEQGDCSRHPTNPPPMSCSRSPTIIDLLPDPKDSVSRCWVLLQPAKKSVTYQIPISRREENYPSLRDLERDLSTFIGSVAGTDQTCIAPIRICCVRKRGR
ncbi:hypothetical protein R1flu_024171 [Riccia fluitans]|uniref:COBRA-like protein n=1 Tax=Riccia fluitans TaxID=41844 RepID=A0ABD1XUJ8_9MARC